MSSFTNQIKSNHSFRDVLHTLWTLTTIYAKPEEEHQRQMEWERHLDDEIIKEIDRTARCNKKRNYKNATVQAFLRST